MRASSGVAGFCCLHEEVVRDPGRSQEILGVRRVRRHAALRPEQDRLVLQVAPQVGNHGVEVDRRQDDADADLGQIVADEVRGRDAHRVVGIRLQLKRDRIAAGVLEHAVAVAVLEPDAGEQALRLGDVVVVVREIRRMPFLVAGTGDRPALRAFAEEHAADERVAIDGHRHRVPEHRVAEPRVFHRIDNAVADALSCRRLFSAHRRLHLVQVEPEEPAVHLGAQAVERVAALLSGCPRTSGSFRA